MPIKFYECRYVRRGDPGGLLWGFNWRPAILVDDGTFNVRGTRAFDMVSIEEHMYDKETGKPVGITKNFCVNPHCRHEDCAPMVLIAEVTDHVPLNNHESSGHSILGMAAFRRD